MKRDTTRVRMPCGLEEACCLEEPVHVSVRVRDEKRKQPRGRRSRCALKTVGHSGW